MEPFSEMVYLLGDQVGSFLSNRASFEFVDLSRCGLIRCGLEQPSAPYQLLCRGEGAHGESPVSVTLSEDLACREEECTAGAVKTVMKLRAVCWYHPHPCVHFHYNVE